MAEQKKEKKISVGAVITEIGSTLNNKTGGWRTNKPEIDQAKCIKCANCWVFCPDSAIYKDNEGKFQINYDYCKGCGICANECPAKCIAMKLEEK